MDLEDMIILIRVYDAMNRIQDAVEMIDGSRCGEGAVGELSWVAEVIRKYSSGIDWKNDPDGITFWEILDDTRFTPDERARRLFKTS